MKTKPKHNLWKFITMLFANQQGTYGMNEERELNYIVSVCEADYETVIHLEEFQNVCSQ